ncbi:plasmid replication protein, CyRepA1 family [Nostoc sp. 'Peltigera membranacea cyanobiont' N6]|uniref:plasmid replication protein, CyRepA1 family n=1 Tax=Nostoc sp. 'Peltigera membranacea cyanobiont' N6 TaxID=1261031 RepID=UPI0015E34A35|nr:plasmid replication protein, CyRepA1 family [Nostoc sp. 'Peltigera membranacea cyanobiont' N6]
MTIYRKIPMRQNIGGNMTFLPTDFQAKHLQEWLSSGVDEEIIALNVRSLSGTLPYEYLLWGTQALEERFRRKYPELRILRIDSESVADPSHAAFGCIAHLNEILTQYDLVIASPSLETGVSIDIRGHFDGVWGIFQGVQPVNSVRQMLARVRETVDRHIWVREWGMSVVGNGSTTIGGLLRSQHVATQANIALLSAADNDDYSFVDQNFQPESLQTWGKRGSVINVEMRRYRESVLAGLVEDGYIVIDTDDVDDDESGAVIESVKAASVELYTAECKAIADSPTISDPQLKKLQDTRAKTKTERHQQRKAELSRRYEVDVTPNLVEKDDDGWYPQLRMHYYLTLGREFLTNRDAKRAKAQLEAGENSVWKPDFNRGQMLPAVLLLEELNLLQLLPRREQLRSSDEAMQEFKALAVKHRHVIKNYLHVTISEKLTSIAIAQKLLAKIDLKLNYVGRLGKRENRECVYRFVAPDDERNSIFGQWLNRDELFLSESVSVSNKISTTTPVTDTTSLSISHNTEVVSGTNNIVFATPLSDTTPHTPENIAILEWKGLMLKMQLGLNSAGSFYSELISKVGSAVGVADSEPYWNGYLGQWQVWVNFGGGCTSVVCDWLVVV